MTPLQRRFKKIVQRFGEAFTTAGHSGVGIIAPVTTSQASTYLTSAESGAAGRPIRMAYVPYDDPTAENASVAWNGLTLIAKRIVEVRYRGATVAKVVVLI